MKSKKANLLTENLVFIILNVSFFVILLVFVYIQSSSIHLDEERIAKQITLIIDSAREDTLVKINFGDFLKRVEKNGVSSINAIKIDNDKNLVIVKGDKNSFYEYAFFNNLSVEYKLENKVLVMEFKK
jgi:hypothetical protein